MGLLWNKVRDGLRATKVTVREYARTYPQGDYDGFDEVEVLGDEVLAVVHDEDAADVELDVVALLL